MYQQTKTQPIVQQWKHQGNTNYDVTALSFYSNQTNIGL